MLNAPSICPQMMEIQTLHRKLQGILWQFYIDLNANILEPAQFARAVVAALPHPQNDFGIGAAVGGRKPVSRYDL